MPFMCCSTAENRATTPFGDGAAASVFASSPASRVHSRYLARPLDTRGDAVHPSVLSQSRQRITRDDIENVRVAIENELAAGARCLSDAEIVVKLAPAFGIIVVSIGKQTLRQVAGARSYLSPRIARQWIVARYRGV